MGLGELVIGKREGGIAFHCLIEQPNSLRQALRLRRTENSSRDQRFSPDIKIVSSKISRWFLLDGRFLLGREFGF